MKQLVSISVFLFLWSSTAAQPYTITIQNRNINNFTLVCQDSGQIVTNAVFSRNGLIYSSDETVCRSQYGVATNGLLGVILKPGCEGYYQCGVQITSVSYIFSRSILLNAYPVILPGTSNNLVTTVTLGKDAKLYCPFQASALNSFLVTWQRLVNGASNEIDYPINEDYSVVIPNTAFDDAGTYFCTVTSIPFQNALDARINGPFNSLIVTRMHVPPVFSRDLSFRKNSENDHVFQINSKGTDPLSFKWFLENELMDSQEFEATPLDSNQVVEKLSRFEIEDFSTEEEYINLTVIVENIDQNGESYLISVTTFILLIEEEDDDEETTPSIIITNEKDNLQIWKEEILTITVYLLLFLVIASWMLITILIVVLIHCTFQKKKKKDKKSIQNDEPSEESLEMAPVARRTNKQTDSPFNFIIPCQVPLDPVEYPNPVSFILFKVASMYWNTKPSDCSLMGSLEQVLIRMLDDDDLMIDNETMNCIKKLRDGVQEFHDRLREEHRQHKRQYSRQMTNLSRPSILSTKWSSYQCLDDADGAEFDIKGYEEQEDALDEIDGDDIPQSFNDMSKIATLLTKYIDDRIANLSNHPPPSYAEEIYDN